MPRGSCWEPRAPARGSGAEPGPAGRFAALLVQLSLGAVKTPLEHFGSARALKVLNCPTNSSDFMSVSSHGRSLLCLSRLPGGALQPGELL